MTADWKPPNSNRNDSAETYIYLFFIFLGYIIGNNYKEILII